MLDGRLTTPGTADRNPAEDGTDTYTQTSSSLTRWSATIHGAPDTVPEEPEITTSMRPRTGAIDAVHLLDTGQERCVRLTEELDVEPGIGRRLDLVLHPGHDHRDVVCVESFVAWSSFDGTGRND